MVLDVVGAWLIGGSVNAPRKHLMALLAGGSSKLNLVGHLPCVTITDKLVTCTQHWLSLVSVLHIRHIK